MAVRGRFFDPRVNRILQSSGGSSHPDVREPGGRQQTNLVRNLARCL